MVGVAIAAAAAAADGDGLLQRLQLHERQVGGGHVRGGARAGHLGGHFLFQTERQGL